MWRLRDATRLGRRQAHIELEHSVYVSYLAQEQKPEFRPIHNVQKYTSIGGETGRSMLVSWLFRETERLHLAFDTACLAVSFLERILNTVQIPLSSAHQYASTCLLLATKLEESGGDGMQIPDDIDVDRQVELYTVSRLQWKLIVPTASTFLRIFAHRIWLPLQSSNNAHHYLTCILVGTLCLQFCPAHASLSLSSSRPYFEDLTTGYEGKSLMLRFRYTDSDSQLFFPSSIALICILFLERDGLLPDVCKDLALKAVRETMRRAREVAEAFRIFRQRCPPPPRAHDRALLQSTATETETDESASSLSSTAPYPSSTTTSDVSRTS